MAIIPLKGLFETHLTVSNLDASIAFYRDVVGLELAHSVPDRHAAFFWIAAPGKAMLGLWSIHSSPLNLRLHLAFDATIYPYGAIKADDSLKVHAFTQECEILAVKFGLLVPLFHGPHPGIPDSFRTRTSRRVHMNINICLCIN